MVAASFEIETPRLLLVPISMAYAQDVFRCFTPEVAKYMFPQPGKHIEETNTFILSSTQAMDQGSNLQLVMLEKESKAFLGCIGLHNTKNSDPEMGIWLGSEHHGRRYGMEASSALIQWAKLHLSYIHLRYPVDKRNTASRRIPESHGARPAREFKSLNQIGFELDLVEYWIQ